MGALIGSAIVGYILLFFVPVVAICLAYPYLGLRLRDSREEVRDNEIGAKAAYYLLLSAAILMVLLGLTVSACDVMEGTFQKEKEKQAPVFGKEQDKEIKERIQRVALSIITSGVLISLVIIILLKFTTNDARFPSAKRIFVGGRMAVAGMVCMITVTTLIALLFQKDIKDNTPYEVITGVLMVWAPALAIHIVLMKVYSSAGYHVASESGRRISRRAIEEDDE